MDELDWLREDRNCTPKELQELVCMCQQQLGTGAWDWILREGWNVSSPIQNSVMHNLTYWQGFQATALIGSSALRSLAKVKFYLLCEAGDMMEEEIKRVREAGML